MRACKHTIKDIEEQFEEYMRADDGLGRTEPPREKGRQAMAIRRFVIWIRADS